MLPPRLRYALARRGPAVALALAVLALAAFGAAAWTAANPPTHTVTDHTNDQRVALSLDANATVTGNGSLYDPGTTLHDPVVYPDAAPVVRVTPRVRSANASFSRVSTSVSVVYTATHRGDVFWTRVVPLATRNATDVHSLAAPVSVDTARVHRALHNYSERVGGAGSVSASLRVNATYRVAGYAGALSTTDDVAFGTDWYAVGAKGATRRHDTPVRRTVVTPSLRVVPPVAPALLGVAFALAAAAVLGWHRAWRPDAAGLADAVHRHRYAEWVSEGRVPPADDGETVVEVGSLEDLVDVAIDTSSRVVRDADTGRYVVLDGGVRYRYVPDAPASGD